MSGKATLGSDECTYLTEGAAWFLSSHLQAHSKMREGEGAGHGAWRMGRPPEGGGCSAKEGRGEANSL